LHLIILVLETQTSLSEEKAMADWIRTNAPDVLMQLWPEIEASIAKGEEGQSVETEK
jgi:hypothetical protein